MSSHRTALLALLAVTFALPATAGCKKLISAAADDAPSATAMPSSPVALPSAVPAESPTQITFKKKDPAVGSSFTVTDTNSMSFELTKPTKTSGGSEEKAERKVEILGAEGRTIQRVKVTYSEKSETAIDEGKETTKRPAVRGKSYVVEAKDGKVVVFDDNRKAPKKEEIDVVHKDMSEVVGKPDKMLSALPDIPVKVGDSAAGLAEWVKDGLLEMGSGIEISSTTVKLREVKTDANGRLGIFDVKVVLNMKHGAINFKMDLAGDLEVRADGRPQAVRLNGPIEVKGGGAEGTGKLTSLRKLDY